MAYFISSKILGPYFRLRIPILTGTEHVPKSGPVLFVANHVSYNDPILIYAALMKDGARRIHTITKWRIFKVPFFRHWSGAIPLYEDRSLTYTMALTHLQQGENVLIYPEGGTNDHPFIGTVKTGAARLGLQTHCPIIPIGVERLKPRAKSQSLRIFEIVKGELHIHIGKPIDISRFYHEPVTRDLLHQVSGVIMTEVAALAHKKYIGK